MAGGGFTLHDLHGFSETGTGFERIENTHAPRPGARGVRVSNGVVEGAVVITLLSSAVITVARVFLVVVICQHAGSVGTAAAERVLVMVIGGAVSPGIRRHHGSGNQRLKLEIYGYG